MKKLLPLLLLSATFATAQAQHEAPGPQQVIDWILQHPEQTGATASDVKELAVQDMFFARESGLLHTWVQQGLNGHKIFGAITGLHFNREGKVVHVAKGFEAGIASRVKAAVNPLPLENLIGAAGQVKEANLSGRSLVAISGIAPYKQEWKTEPVYHETVWFEKGNLLLEARLITFFDAGSGDWWNLLFDASTAELLWENSWTAHCIPAPLKAQSGEDYNYRVFNFPSESPNHGSRVTMINSPDDQASPFGWHDTDGIAGPEYLITRGNNVYASEDADANNRPGYSPDGGSALLFDYPWDSLSSNPSGFRDFAITNLFTANNSIHDILWRYGFDEASGNFQTNNYGRGGEEGDEVFADAQDGSGTNNANFATPPDGTNPRMQMFIWRSGSSLFTLDVREPVSVRAKYTAVASSFGPRFNTTPIAADMVWVNDGTGTPKRGCAAFTNAADVAGKIAVIERGTCNFSDKVRNAMNAGAVAAVVVNNQAGNPFAMSGTGTGDITIPSLMISQASGSTLNNAITAGTAKARLYDSSGTGRTFDSDLDMGVISHEYGHGLSIRLTCGPSNSNGLSNDEQMGEGWSDFLALAFTARKGDLGSTPRGIGTYLLGQPTTGAGIRTYRYSTNMTVNPHTYSNVSRALNGTRVSPHYVGEIWCSILWDLHWNMVEKYGFSENLSTGDGGNNRCIRLVVDGMKLQRCNPGFVDARDAILKADSLRYGGANSKLIWETFARRGLGVNADQGDADDVQDGSQDFELPQIFTISTENIRDRQWRIFPNPAGDRVYVEAMTCLMPETLQLLDMSGRTVKRIQAGKGATAISFEVRDLQPGTYMLSFPGGRAERLVIAR